MRVTYELDLLERLGTQLGMPHVRRLQGSELWELRIRGGTDYRIFYVAIAGRRFVLLHGFRKQSQRTPRREIRVAEQRLADYRNRRST